jgi:hypothetical protein
MASLGQLVVSLTAETAQFRQAMDRAAYQSQKNFKDITGAAKFVGGALGVAFSVGGIVAYTKSLIDTANQIQDVADRAGVAAEELSRIGVAAKLNASSQEEANDAIVKLSKSIAEAASGSKAQEDAFKRLGVSIRDSAGNVKSTTDVFYELADGFAATQDGAAKVKTAQDLLGRSGANLIPLFNQGSKALKEYNAQFDAQFLQNSAEFNNNIDQLTTNFGRLAAQLLGPVLSGLNAVFGTPVGKDLDAAIERTKEKIDDLRGAIAASEYGGKDGIFRSGKESAEILRKELFLAEAQLQRYVATKEVANAKDKKSLDITKEDDPKQKTLLATIEKLQSEYNALFLTKGDLAVLDAQNLGATKEQIGVITTLSTAIREQTEIQKEQEKAQSDALQKQKELEAQVSRIFTETRSPIEALNIRLGELNDLLDKGAINWDVWARASEVAQDAYDRAVDTAKQTQTSVVFVRDLGNAIGTAFEDAVMSGKGFMDVLKGLEQDIIRIIFRLYIMKSIESTIGNTSGPIGGFLDSLFGGGKAIGGPVSSGTAYLVGERGPELFVPPSGGGSIVPNEQLGSSGISVVNNFVISTPTDRRTQQQIGAMAGMGVQRAISRNT